MAMSSSYIWQNARKWLRWRQVLIAPSLDRSITQQIFASPQRQSVKAGDLARCARPA
jgi:hypothetical protein